LARTKFKNPFRPGAGHMPPYFAGRKLELEEFQTLLKQDVILKNVVLTGLRGIGKTVLLETFKPMAVQVGWLWAGTDMSETTSITEDNLAIRLLTDLSVVSGSYLLPAAERRPGFKKASVQQYTPLNFPVLKSIYDGVPGLIADKLKGVLEVVWPHIEASGKRGIVFAYDEAQNLADHKSKDQYPLSLLLDVFQSLQRKGMRFMLALTGLPTLFAKLVEARTFAERMFHVIFLSPLNEEETRDAVSMPIKENKCPNFSAESISAMWAVTHGYPYFVQYVCREVFDVWVQAVELGHEDMPGVPISDIMRKLDTDFFAGRWARATDRQRELLWVIANLENPEAEFSVQEVVDGSNRFLDKPFSSSHVNQMLVSLSEAGLTYKNRHGKYSFAVPLLADFIKRQSEPA
jgi:hypothetical protein